MVTGNNFQDLLGDRVHKRALRDVIRSSDFPLSQLVRFLGPEALTDVQHTIAKSLGERGYIGFLYIEQADIGSGKEDLDVPRVNIKVRDGKATNSPPRERLGSSNAATILTFPDEPR